MVKMPGRSQFHLITDSCSGEAWGTSGIMMDGRDGAHGWILHPGPPHHSLIVLMAEELLLLSPSAIPNPLTQALAFHSFINERRVIE